MLWCYKVHVWVPKECPEKGRFKWRVSAYLLAKLTEVLFVRRLLGFAPCLLRDFYRFCNLSAVFYAIVSYAPPWDTLHHRPYINTANSVFAKIIRWHVPSLGIRWGKSLVFHLQKGDNNTLHCFSTRFESLLLLDSRNTEARARASIGSKWHQSRQKSSHNIAHLLKEAMILSTVLRSRVFNPRRQVSSTLVPGSDHLHRK